MREYEHTDKLSENRLPQYAYAIPYESLEKALAGKRSESRYYRLLNGNWDFAYFHRDIDVPDNPTDVDSSPITTFGMKSLCRTSTIRSTRISAPGRLFGMENELCLSPSGFMM